MAATNGNCGLDDRVATQADVLGWEDVDQLQKLIEEEKQQIAEGKVSLKSN